VTALVLLALAGAFVGWKLTVDVVKVLLLVLIIATAVVVIPIHRGLRLLL